MKTLRFAVFSFLIISKGICQTSLEKPYPSDYGFSRSNDTIYFGNSGELHIHKIVKNNKVYEYYFSGNLLGEGMIKPVECNNQIGEGENESQECSYILDGDWIVYYDTALQIKYSRIIFKNGDELYSEYYSPNGLIRRKEYSHSATKSFEEYDPAGNLISQVEYIYINKEKFFLSRLTYANKKESVAFNTPRIYRFVLLHVNLFLTVLVIFGVLKLILSTIIFRTSTPKPNWIANRVSTAFKSAFIFFIRRSGKLDLLVLVHNVIAISTIIILVVVLLSVGVVRSHSNMAG